MDTGGTQHLGGPVTRADNHTARLRQFHNAPRLGQPATGGNPGLGNADFAPIHQIEKFPARGRMFTGGNAHRGLFGQAGIRFQ